MKVEALQARGRGGIPMAKQGKNAMEDFSKMFEGTPCAEMMRRMMEGKAEGQRFSCAEMMTQMIQMCCRGLSFLKGLRPVFISLFPGY
jgi:hypothetical protein